MRPGRLVYLAFFAPLAFVARLRREGPLNLLLTARGKRAMVAAAARLAPVPCAPAPAGTPVVFLTGRSHWYQTAFCAQSLLRLTETPLAVTLVDDGSIDDALAAEMARCLPGVRIQRLEATERLLEERLPARLFPALRRRRLTYIHLRKLTDVHADGGGWKLVLDSDMLFHKRPDELLAWLRRPTRPVHMVDCQDSYGYSAGLLRELAGAAMPPRINVGICGLDGAAIDWHELERWCGALEAREGTSYYLEQALVALMLARRERAAMPERDYRVLPGPAEILAPTAVMHHYVDKAKALYLRRAWRQVAARRGSTPPDAALSVKQ